MKSLESDPIDFIWPWTLLKVRLVNFLDLQNYAEVFDIVNLIQFDICKVVNSNRVLTGKVYYLALVDFSTPL